MKENLLVGSLSLEVKDDLVNEAGRIDTERKRMHAGSVAGKKAAP